MKLVGTGRPLHDAKGKVSGTTVYAGDMMLPHMSYAELVTSTIPHGMVKSIDKTEALAVEGVIDILDCFNTTNKKFSRYKTLAWQDVPEQDCIFNQHVRFVGDRVALVVAETLEAAKKAARLVKVEYEEYPFAVTSQEAMSGKIDNVYEEGAVFEALHCEMGDKSKVAENTIKVTTNTHLSRIHHAAMETHCCVASYDKAMDQLTIWSPNQACFGIRAVVSDIFKMPYHKVRVIKTTMGGSFGGKQEWMLEPVTAAAALRVKRPVKLVFNRSQEFTSTISRSPMDSIVTTQFTKDGQLQSIELDNTLNAGAYLGNSLDYCGAMSKKMFRTYHYPYAKYSSRAVITNNPVSGAFRGWTAPELCIMIEHNLNMAARKLNIDPLELRLKNAAIPGSMDLALEETLDNAHVKECLELGRDKFDWDNRRKANKEFNAQNKRYKRGCAVAAGGHLSGYFPRIPDFSEVGLKMTESGSVIVSISLHDHGCGTVEAMRMIVADALEIDEDMVLVGEADTQTTPFDVGCFSSRTTYVLGKNAYKAAIAMKKRMKNAVSRILNYDEDDIEIRDGIVTCVGHPNFKWTYGDVARESLHILKEELSIHEQYKNRSNPAVNGVHFAEVEVDTYTGMTRILNYLAVHDIGQAINREICIAQTQGAVLMGGGAAIYEHGFVRENGQPLTSFKDYHLINSYEAPNIQVEFIEDGSLDGPYGAKSIGEVSHVEPTAAVMGAINEALQSEFDTIPINPDAIVKYLASKEEK